MGPTENKFYIVVFSGAILLEIVYGWFWGFSDQKRVKRPKIRPKMPWFGMVWFNLASL